MTPKNDTEQETSPVSEREDLAAALQVIALLPRAYKEQGPEAILQEIERTARMALASPPKQVSDETKRQRAYRRRKEAGVCTRCTEPAANGQTLCLTHLERGRQRNDKERSRARKKDLCISCRKNPRRLDRTKCRHCGNRDAAAMREKRAREAGRAPAPAKPAPALRLVPDLDAPPFVWRGKKRYPWKKTS